MKILYLGPAKEGLVSFLKSSEDNVLHWEEKLTIESEVLYDVDFIISYSTFAGQIRQVSPDVTW